MLSAVFVFKRNFSLSVCCLQITNLNTVSKTRGRKSKGNNSNQHSSTWTASSASRCKSTISIQQETSNATAVSTQQQDTVSSFTSPFVSIPENHAPMSMTARSLTVDNIPCIMQEVVKYLSQLQRQQLTSQPATTALTYSGDQVRSTPQEVTTTSRANKLNPMQPTDVITSQALQHIRITNWRKYVVDPLSPPTNTVALGAGLPPVPSKIVAIIEAGEFIDMGELLSDRVGMSRLNDTGKALTKHCTVSGILEWIKCFNVYIAVNS